MPTRCCSSPTRGVADDVRKVLASAVANAVHNDDQDAEELFVLACFADEGPTLRRFRPRARGRATRIRKRTCHITVDRRPDERRPPRDRPGPPGRPHRRRPPPRRHVGRRPAVTASSAAAQRAPSASPPARASSPMTAEDREAGVDEPRLSTTNARARAAAVLAPEDGSIPEGYEIKGNANSMKYHVPGGRYYDATIAEVVLRHRRARRGCRLRGARHRRSRHRRSARGRTRSRRRASRSLGCGRRTAVDDGTPKPRMTPGRRRQRPKAAMTPRLATTIEHSSTASRRRARRRAQRARRCDSRQRRGGVRRASFEEEDN